MVRRSAAALVVAGVALWSMRRWFPARVEGESMRPTLAPGDLLAVRPLRASEPRPGQIVVVRTPEREVIKRVARAPHALPEGEVWVVGDNAGRSTDSRVTGPVPLRRIAGIVRARYWPPRRACLFRG